MTGLHGLGTSQLAAAYARAKLAAGWRLVAWVHGADTFSLLAGLAAVADATGLADGDSGRGVTDAGAAVRHWLETDGDQDTIRARTDLARAYHQTGRVDDAIPLVEQILAARERLFGADHPGTLAARNNLASAYRATGRAAEAIPLFERNMAICERLFGADHPKTLASRRNLDLARQELAESETAGRRPQQE